MVTTFLKECFYLNLLCDNPQLHSLNHFKKKRLSNEREGVCVYVYVYIHFAIYIYIYIIPVIKKTFALLFYLENTHKIHSFWLFFPFSDSEVNPVTLGLEETPRLTRTHFSMRMRHQNIVQSVTCLLCQPEAPSSDPQYPQKSWIVACISTPGKEAVGSTEAHQLDSRIRSTSTRSSLFLDPLPKK